MRQNYERLAWIVLLLSFVTCVGLAIGVPLTIQATLRDSYTGELVMLNVQQEGALLVTCPGNNIPVGVVDQQENLCDGREGTLVSTGLNDQGLLTIHSRTASSDTLATVQLYPGTRLTLQKARAPRFPSFSPKPHLIVMHLDSGRVRVDIPSGSVRTTLVQISTPQSLVETTNGSAAIEVTNQESQISVREGLVSVTAETDGSAVLLDSAQRVAVPTGGGVTEVMPAERNLLAGYSDFREPLGATWKVYSVTPEIDGESPGVATNLTVENLQVVELSRYGIGHAETGITQEINRDIRDFRSLYLHVKLRILQQDVPVCGTLGTECPIMVRLDYVDETDTAQSWQQGFYYLPDPNSINPKFCVMCDPRNLHTLIPQDTWHVYDSPKNLAIDLAKDGAAPRFLKSITIYASGHTYRTQVAEVELTGQE